MLNNKTILITGGTGSFGHHFVDYALSHYSHTVIGDWKLVPAVVNDILEERDDRSPAAHDVSVSGTADDCIPLLRRHPGVGVDDPPATIQGFLTWRGPWTSFSRRSM